MIKKSISISKCSQLFIQFSSIGLASALIFNLSACTELSRENVGMLTGGALGGALGSTIGHGKGRIAAAVGGTLLGAVVGGAIGKSMDEIDRLKMNQALESAPTNSPYAWQNPDNGNALPSPPQLPAFHAMGSPAANM